MQKRVLFSIFAVLFLFVVGVLLLLLRYNTQISSETLSDKKRAQKSVATVSVFSTWTKKLSSYKHESYLMPVTDLFIKIGFKKRQKIEKSKKVIKKETFYRLVVSKLDRYSLFCILRIFQKNNIPFVIERGSGDSKIFLNLKDRGDLTKIAAELKKYDIVSKIVLINR